MNWVFLALFAYTFFELFHSKGKIALAIGLMRVALVFVVMFAFRFHEGIIFAGGLMAFAVCALGAMGMMRREIQLQQEDTEGEA